MNFLNKNVINFDDKIFGLDLSDMSIKILQLEKNGDSFRVKSFSSQDIPSGILEEGVVADKEKIVSIIKESLKKAVPKKISTKKVICSLPESKAFLRVLSIPNMDEESAKEAIKWEIEASIPLSVDQVYYDWQFIENIDEDDSNKNKQSVLTVAVSKEVVDGLMDVFQSAGLEVYGLELESVASARSLIQDSPENKEDAFLIVDLGARRTSFIVTKGNVPFFTSSIPFSSEGITDAISKDLGISREEAENMKISKGLEDCTNDRIILNSIEPLLENLTSEIEKTIDFYENMSEKEGSIKKIILSGGGANMKGLVAYLVKRLNREVEGGDPWINLNMKGELPPISRENSISYSTVVGLALRSCDYEY